MMGIFVLSLFANQLYIVLQPRYIQALIEKTKVHVRAHE